MTDIVIKQDEPVTKEADETDIKKTLEDADEYKKLKESNDKLEAEVERQQALKAKLALGSSVSVGQPVKQKTEEEKVQEEASKYINAFD